MQNGGQTPCVFEGAMNPDNWKSMPTKFPVDDVIQTLLAEWAMDDEACLTFQLNILHVHTKI